LPELLPQFYNQVIPLVRASGMRGHLALVYELLEGRMPGQVYVDSIVNPRTSLVCNSNGFYFAFGKPDEDMVGPLVERFWALNQREIYTTLFGSSPAWDDSLQRLCSSLGAGRETRLAFERRNQPIQPPVPEGLTLHPITVQLAERILDGTGTSGYGLDPWFIRVAGGPTAYASLGLGMVLLDGDLMVSMCGVCGLGSGEAEMEVGTIPGYRGRGLAPIVCAAFMEQCHARGLHPTYSCSSQNTPSIAVAHKLGFVEVEEIHGYRLYREE
jgi:ribosomal protein S18 acetylase RimI-like enzyme